MIKGTFGIQKLDDVEATLSVTMTVGEWREVLSQLSTKWPSWKFGEVILNMISAFSKNFEYYEEQRDELNEFAPHE